MQLGRLRSVSWRDPPSRRPVEIYGDVRSEVVDGHIRVLTVRAEKKNASRRRSRPSWRPRSRASTTIRSCGSACCLRGRAHSV